MKCVMCDIDKGGGRRMVENQRGQDEFGKSRAKDGKVAAAWGDGDRERS